MRIVLQRVERASVVVDGRSVGAIGPGLLLLVGVKRDDDDNDATYLAEKVANLRIFEDDNGKMNRSALDLGLAALVVSQFTLYGNTRKGRRPSFIDAAPPEIARPLVNYFASCLSGIGIPVETGEFGAHMSVQLVNDGPVTIWLDTEELRGSD